MEKYERYRRYKFSKAFDGNMNTITFDNLHISFNGGDIENVQIVRYRTGNYLHINRYNPAIVASVIYLNNVTINSQVIGEVLLNGSIGELRIIFNTQEQKIFFLNEIESDNSSSAESESTDSGNDSHV
ncbi:hypothetical protein QE152_g23524 [Popillia japonica]|uniref:Uncharacterized protein n=1 Tax=Popillia japonica TaxID=7064 RepID=A0AAW1KGP4_POPJA